MFTFWAHPQISHDLILSEIRSMCSSQGVEVTEAMAVFTVSNTLVVPKHKFYDSSKDPHYDIVRITNLAVKDIISKTGLKLQLMKAQAYFSKDFGSQEQVLKDHAKLYDMYIEPLKKQIIRSSPNPNVQISPNVLFRQVVLFLVLSSGMGDPSQPDVYMEAECALASIFSQEDLMKFIRLTRSKKGIELDELNKLLVGIRLFNKVRRLGGAGLDNLPNLLTKASSSTQSILDDALTRIWNKLGPLEKAIELEFEWDPQYKYNMILSQKRQFSNQDLAMATDMLLLWQQISYYLTIIMGYVKKHIIELTNTKEALNQRLNALVEHTKCKVAIETSLIYPQFKKVYQYWKTFQDLLILHSVYNKMIRLMMQYAKVKTVPKPLLKLFSHPHGSRHEEELADFIDQETASYEVIHPQKHENYTLQFGGFCPIYALLAGVILKVRKNIGILKVNNKYYGFRNKKAAYYFSKNPELTVKQIVDMARNKPEFIEILQIRDMVMQYSFPLAAPVPLVCQMRTTCGKSVQTELHPYQSNIDHWYKSTTWGLKEDACQLANMLKMKTHSSQTDESHFSSEIGTQVSLPKDIETQTMSDNYTNTPKLQNFIYGLRGQKEDLQHTVTLTRPVDEGFYNIV